MSELLIGTAGGLFTPDGSSAFEGRDVTALSFDGARVWALLDTREVWMRDGDWRIVTALDDGEGASLLATQRVVLVGTEGAHLYRIDGDKATLLDAFEDAPGRSSWYTPWGGPPAVRSMSAAGDDIYVNVHVGGILRTRDLSTFEPTIDKDTDVHEVVASTGGALAALGVEGVARSTDHGSSWEITTDGLHGGYARAGDALLATASSGPFAKDGAVYRSTGGTFERCADLPERAGGNLDTGWLAASGVEAAIAYPDGSVYRSEDAGVSWQQVADHLPEPRWLVFAP